MMWVTSYSGGVYRAAKPGATRLGSGLLISGESDPAYVQVLSEGGESSVKLIDKAGREQLIKP